MNKAVISGDIIAYTSLSNAGKATLEKALKNLLEELKSHFDVYGRLIKGDYLECVVPEPQNALRVALAIKSCVKSISVKEPDNNRFRFFRIHGIRLAIGYGSLSRYDTEKGIIDGEAIYLSGRAINEERTHNKKRVVIKNTLFFTSANERYNAQLEPLLALLDVLMSKATARQSEVLYLKLMGLNEEEIAAALKISQPVVNQHSTSVGWNAIEKAVFYFSELLKNP